MGLRATILIAALMVSAAILYARFGRPISLGGWWGEVLAWGRRHAKVLDVVASMIFLAALVGLGLWLQARTY